MHNIFNLTVIYLSVLILVLSQTMPAYAGIIGTEQFMAQELGEIDRETLRNTLERDDARRLLEKHGVSTEQAQKRINSMTDEEIKIVAQKFNELPAGGSVGVVAAVLIVILLILILDLSGKTDVFTGV